MAIITISRGSHAGGKAVAELVGQRLGQPVLGREEVLTEAAQSFGIVESELKSALDDSPRFWQQVPGKRLAFAKSVTAVLLEKASEGNLIYHGNVGHLLLSGIPHALRVRVIAEMGLRVQSAMKHGGMTQSEALAHIRRVDDDRKRWAQLLYGVDWEDPSQYSVVLNLAHLTPEGACETIVRMAELDEFRPTPARSKNFEDHRLGCRVWAALAKNPITRSAGIEVSADGGQVLIQGSVPSAKAAELLPGSRARSTG